MRWLNEHPRPNTEEPLIGRRASLERLGALWRSGERCLTLVGPPGVGKTRLALEAHRRAAELFDVLAGSSHVCRLAGSTSAAEVGTRIADAMDVPAEMRGGDAGSAVCRWLSLGPGGILLLDNAEQAHEVVGRLVEQLRREAPQYGYLVTSRVPLGIDGESQVSVDPLTVPEPSETRPDLLLESEAVRLFLSTSGYGEPPSEPDMVTVARVVRRLEGLPLSIVLAARRLETLSVAELDERLEDRFAILRYSRRDGVRDQHDALWLTLDWSWQLLTAWQRDALGQMAVFRGAFTLPLAERVVQLTVDDGPMAPTVIDALQVLVRHSLIQRHGEAGSSTRFRMLETIREFAMRHWSDSPRRSLWTRYAEVVAADAEALVIASRRHDGKRAFAELSALREDLVALVRGADGLPAPADQAIARAATGLSELLDLRGEQHARLELLDEVCARFSREARADAALERLVGRLERERARVLHALDRRDEGVAAAEAALETATRLNDAWLAAYARLTLGQLLSFVDRPAAERSLQAARDMAPALPPDDRDVILASVACIEANLAMDRGDDEACHAYLLEGLSVVERSGWELMKITLLLQLGIREMTSGDPSRGVEHVSAARALAQRCGSHADETLADGILAEAALARGEPADELLDPVVERFRRVHDSRNEAYARFNRAVSYLMVRRLGAARDDLDHALSALEALADPYYRAACESVMAAVTAVDGKAPRARELMARARAGQSQLDPHLTVYPSLFEPVVEAALSEAPSDELRARLKQAGAAIPSSGALKAAEALLEVALGRRSVWRIDPGGAWFESPEGQRVDLKRQRALRRILANLAARSVKRPGEGLTRAELFGIGWPDERIDQRSAANRVYVALSTLRKLGLEELLLHRDGEYLLDPTQRVALVSEPPAPEDASG